MKLNVHVHGIDFAIPCGEGGQTFKWLGLAVAQRYAHIAPHGRCRTREEVHVEQGFFLPGNITKTQTGQILLPTKKINEQCKDNDQITVQLMQEIQVNEIGAPQLTPWAITAFCQRGSAAGGGGEPKLSDDHETSNTSKPTGTSIEEEMKAYSQSEMLQQMHAGLFHSEMEIEAAFLHDWKQLNVQEFQKEPKENKDKIQSILLNAFSYLNIAYLHYAVGASETSYGMSLMEFSHFIYESGFFHFQKDKNIVHKIFMTALKEKDSFVSMFSKELLSRVGFLHCLIRMILIHTKMYNDQEEEKEEEEEVSSSSSTTTTISTINLKMIEQGIKQKIIPSIQRLTSGPFRDHTHQQKVIAIFQQARQKLLKIYTRYADTTTGLLTVPGLKSMLQESGVFYAGEQEEQEEIFKKAIDQSFVGMKEIKNPTDQVIVYAEFLEVVSRVAIAMVKEDELFPSHEAIKIAVDALKNCKPLKPTRK